MSSILPNKAPHHRKDLQQIDRLPSKIVKDNILQIVARGGTKSLMGISGQDTTFTLSSFTCV
jgi:hypothetical protein